MLVVELDAQKVELKVGYLVEKLVVVWVVLTVALMVVSKVLLMVA